LIRLLALSFIILLSLSACTSTRFGIDSSLFTEEPCKAPCWQKLIPGQSTNQDVEEFLTNLSATEWPGRRMHNYESGCVQIRVTDAISSEEVRAALDFNIEADKLTFIQSDHPEMPKLQEITDHFGKPEYIKAVLAVGPDGSLYILEVYYPSKGVAFTLSPNQDDIDYIRPDMQIDAIQYFATGDLLSYFTVRYSCDIGQQSASKLAQDQISKYIQPWSGYGKVKVIPNQ
jgi:hypothetical protein